MPTFYEAIKQKLGTAYCNVSDFSVWYATKAADILTGTVAESPAVLQETLFKYWNQVACGVDPQTAESFPVPTEYTQGIDDPDIVWKIRGPDFQYNQRNKYIRGVLSWVRTGASNYQDSVVAHGNKVASDAGANGCNVLFDTQSNTPLIAEPPRNWNVADLGLRRIDEIVPVEACNIVPPPPEAEPQPNNLTYTENVDYEDENGNPQTAQDVSFTFGEPYLEPDGTISVPYEVCYDGICFKGKENFGTGINLIEEPPFKVEPVEPCPTLEEIEGLLNQKDRTEEILDAIEEIPEPFLFVPNSWKNKLAPNRPQLIAGMYEKDGDKYSPSKWDICIPHPVSNIEQFTVEDLQNYFPDYRRGKYYARAELSDGSSFMVHAVSQSAAETYMNRVLSLVRSDKLPSGDFISTGKNPRVSREVDVRVGVLGYYSEGRKNGEKPTKRWYVKREE